MSMRQSGRSYQQRSPRGGGRYDFKDSFSARRHPTPNPWQSGQAPGYGGGGGGGMRGGSGLLPTPAEHGRGLDTETQLALANNLISALLQNQQQPSSFSPGYSGGSHRIQHSPPPFYRGSTRISDGLMGPPPSKFGRTNMGGKFSGGFGSRERRPFDMQRERRNNQGPRGRPNDGPRNKNTGQQRTPKKSDIVSAKQKKKEDVETSSTDAKKDGSKKEDAVVNGKEVDTDDESKEKDKDKDDDEVQVIENDEGEDEKDEEEEGKEGEKDSEKDDKPVRTREYIPADYLNCTLCGVYKMQRESSFVEHVKGRKHQMLMEYLEEKMGLQMKLVRHEIMMAQKKVDLDFWRRRQKTGEPEPKRMAHCTMCHIRFVGDINVHRAKDPLHNKLRKFLHPHCCNHSFESPIQYERHILTLSHIRRMWYKERDWKQKEEEGGGIPASCFPRPEEAAASITLAFKKEVERAEEEKAGEESSEVEVMDVKEDGDDEEKKEKTEDEEKDEQSKEGDEEEAEKKDDSEKNEEDPVDKKAVPVKKEENFDLEYIPQAFDHEVSVGEHVLQPMTGFFCPLCYKVVPEDLDARQRHCRTRMHFDRYVVLKSKIKKEREEEQAAKLKAAEDKKKEVASEKEQKEVTNEDNDGNWKRAGRKRKLAGGDAEGDDEDENWEEHVIDEVMDESELDKNTGSMLEEGASDDKALLDDTIVSLETSLAMDVSAGTEMDKSEESFLDMDKDLDTLLESAKEEVQLAGEEEKPDEDEKPDKEGNPDEEEKTNEVEEIAEEESAEEQASASQSQEEEESSQEVTPRASRSQRGRGTARRSRARKR